MQHGEVEGDAPNGGDPGKEEEERSAKERFEGANNPVRLSGNGQRPVRRAGSVCGAGRGLKRTTTTMISGKNK